MAYEAEKIGEREDSSAVYGDGNLSLTRSDFEQITKEYGLGKLTSDPKVLAGGYSNDIFQVDTDTGTYVFRSSRDAENPHAISQKSLEYAITDHLTSKETDFESPRYHVTSSGSKQFDLEGRTFEVYDMISGGHAPEHGRLTDPGLVKGVADYFTAMQDFAVPNDILPIQKSTYTDEAGKNLERLESTLYGDNSQEADMVRDHLDQIKDLYRSVSENFPGSTPDVVVHGDLHMKNIIFEDGSFKGFIDYGEARLGRKADDLARITTTGSPEDIGRVVNEYRKHAPLSDEEADEILPRKILNGISFVSNAYEKFRNGEEFSDRAVQVITERLPVMADSWKKYLTEKEAA